MNRIAIITGANRGIGRETALELAQKKYTVVLACRNTSLAELTCNEIRDKTANPNVYAMGLDLSSFDSIKKFVKSFTEEFGKLNILINNAGITTQQYDLTPDGFEKTLQTNSLGPYMLTKLLLPLFPSGEDNRIINLSSDIYKMGSFTIDKLNSYHWVKAYAVSKYAQLLITLKMTQILAHKEITINAVHPGVVRTNIMFTNKWYDVIINLILTPLYIDETKGAEPSVYLADSANLKGISGKYFKRFVEINIPNNRHNNKQMNQLYDYYEIIFHNQFLKSE